MRQHQIVNAKFSRCTISDPMLQGAILIHTSLNLKKIINANTEGLVIL